MFLFLVAIISLFTADKIDMFNDCKKEDFKPQVCEKYKPKSQ
jgi:hypothetical protein